jgi:hypothetical protein
MKRSVLTDEQILAIVRESHSKHRDHFVHRDRDH